ncbi:GNAT family N-acetyltransferase [Enterovirga rhinocerotis]|uniref:Acetyltransferase (GNAT) family protein n=1 Tax=Enterovirga rhinocerotis TaxID=1339210 RepID=A0A4V3DXB9_9HYPH|nr:GNAT family N-acetyltransferase [Enterovirga rhinocerotis]TDR88079.1 acetyltransferase (GNAT) family protein [Enterovirga rhinocerotis]
MPKTLDPPLRIAPLDDRPQFRKTVADRIWRAWWQDQGVPLAEIDGRVGESLGRETIPTTLVATIGERFAGTVSLIDSDMDERPDYRPWIAALWVDPAHRGSGTGTLLLAAAAAKAFEAGFDRVYLCAKSSKAAFYVSRRWLPIEEDVAGLTIFALAR